ncbi:MAG: HDIG domain-containing protein [Candidatus Amulumruptor caecigallinarius]|nr:HDIG domain-containing protein [Candidatus Amulumruptor caecigallinarius]
MRPESIIEKYYTPGSDLHRVLTVHSRKVADMALECAHARNLDVDMNFIEEAALLHDIGIFLCNAPDIYCTGALPYICHGVEGAKLLRSEGYPRHALVCERHTGAGLSIEDIKRQHLPLPLREMLPVSTEEKIICYADKFYSKSGDIEKRKSPEEVVRSMSRHGEACLQRFMELHRMFGPVGDYISSPL